ncbi:MAG: glycosyl hydrolase, partial [Bacteroidota bacterium]
MKKIFISLLLPGILPVLYAQLPTRNKKVKMVDVFTTAEGTAMRLSPGEHPVFSDYKQPLENEPCIFIDPLIHFQSIIGIGAALTDASAETFAKLPAAQQEEFLSAYFDPKKGIGYT